MLGQNLHNASQSSRPIYRALRTTRDFNSVDVVRCEVREVKLAGQPLINRNTVKKDLHVFARQTAHENGSELTGRTGLDNIESWNVTKRVAHALDLFLLEIVRRNQAHTGRRLIERNVSSRGRDNYRFRFFLIGDCRS